jgi:hypothetical protein
VQRIDPDNKPYATLKFLYRGIPQLKKMGLLKEEKLDMTNPMDQIIFGLSNARLEDDDEDSVIDLTKKRNLELEAPDSRTKLTRRRVDSGVSLSPPSVPKALPRIAGSSPPSPRPCRLPGPATSSPTPFLPLGPAAPLRMIGPAPGGNEVSNSEEPRT